MEIPTFDDVPAGVELIDFIDEKIAERRSTNVPLITGYPDHELFCRGLSFYADMTRDIESRYAGDDRSQVLTAGFTAVLGLLLAGRDLVLQGYLDILPCVQRTIIEWTMLLVYVQSTTDGATRLLNNRLDWKDVERTCRENLSPEAAQALFRDWGVWSERVHLEKKHAVERHTRVAAGKRIFAIGPNGTLQQSLDGLTQLSVLMGNALTVVSKATPATGEWRESLEGWRQEVNALGSS